MTGRLPVHISLYAGGRIVAGGVDTIIETTENVMTYINLPTRHSSYEQYSVHLQCLGSAGVSGWLAYRVSAQNVEGISLGQMGIPALLWTRPWDVPMVCHLPQVDPSIPVHTVALSVLRAYGESISLAPKGGDK